jgi:hypothetical protein
MFYCLDVEQKEVIQRKIARPGMAPQNFNPRSLTFDHVLFDVSHVANTTTNYLIMTLSERPWIKILLRHIRAGNSLYINPFVLHQDNHGADKRDHRFLLLPN